jgi:hypothetical protein
MASISAVTVSYRTSGDVISALRSGDVQLAVETLTPVIPQVKSSAVCAIGITDDTVFPGLPDHADRRLRWRSRWRRAACWTEPQSTYSREGGDNIQPELAQIVFPARHRGQPRKRPATPDACPEASDLTARSAMNIRRSPLTLIAFKK